MGFRAIICFMMISSLTACASMKCKPTYNYMPVTTALSIPPIGTVNTSQVGDIMLREKKKEEYDSIYLKSTINTSWAYTLYPGYYLKRGEDESAEYYYPTERRYYSDSGQVDTAALAPVWISIMVKKEGNAICVVTDSYDCFCSYEGGFERRKKIILTEYFIKQSLIYSGKIGNKVIIGYRESSNDIALPASNNVEYDLSESKLIAYKGAKLEILEATSQYVKYKVLSNFNGASY